MADQYRINLLIPYLDGEYYGTIFTTLHREINKRNSTLFTIHALASVENPAAFDYQIGTEDTDGWLLLMNPYSVLPSSPKFLAAIEASGKPIVTIGYQENSIRCHSVVIDNRQAIKDAVGHLIRDHGHRRIAFVGSTEHVDLIERFEGYREALQDNGIEYDEQLYFHANNSLRHGGASAAQAMMDRGKDFTAVVAATDLNAMGLIESLQASGYRIPDEMAVIGFDDLPSAETFHPPLTSVHQSIADLAQASVELLYRMLDGERLPHNVTYIPTAFIQRASCGCSYQSKEVPIDVLHRRLERSEANINQLISSHNQLAANWASASREEFFDFSRMFREISHWGCLASWETDRNDHRHLIIKQAFSKYNESVPPIGLRIPIEQFPPVNWLPRLGDNDYVRVQSIRSDREDLGFIVLVGPIDKLVLVSEVDITRISCNISVTALVRDQLYNQVRSIAEQLEIVSRTTNDGIWDWDLVTDQIQWSTRTHDMFSSIGETLTGDPDSFFRLVHPEDYHYVTSAFQQHIDDGTPLKIEFRIQGCDNGRQLWLYAAGDSIRDQHGNKVRTIGSLTNITEKKTAENQITRLAYHDVLTGLPNRQLFRERFEQSQWEAERGRTKLGIMLLDLDRFKIINDTLGHQVGDQLLQGVARRMEDIIYSGSPAKGVDRDGGSTVARLGGDEFIILLKDVQDVTQMQLIAERLIQGFQEPFDIENLELFTTASIGISLYPDDGADLDTLYRCADIAMYKAKENGKNRSVTYNGAINSLTFERLSMENELRRALERCEFELHYQPQIDLDKNEIYGVEALIRWRSPERGLVSPAEFIPLAEDSGLIIPIGQWVLREACLQKKQWIDLGLPRSVVSVNISASQLHQNNFVDMVKTVLADTKLPPDALCLEITESTAIMNMQDSIHKLQQLEDLGVHIAIDDFGVGYSSLSMLKQLPIKNVKIDRSFVQDMVVNSDDAAIATAIISLARNLGMIVIAEGVETEAQRKLLMKEQCNCIQGYIYSKPLPPDECLAYMRNYR